MDPKHANACSDVWVIDQKSVYINSSRVGTAQVVCSASYFASVLKSGAAQRHIYI